MLSETKSYSYKKYVDIIWTNSSKSGKTDIYIVTNKNGVKLGAIKWHSQWRKYVFCPSPDTIFDERCFDEISSFLVQTTLVHKQEHERT